MDVFRFEKLPLRANDTTRRYRIVRGLERDQVGTVEVSGDAPEGESLQLTVVCQPILSDAAREDALATTRRFLDEMVTGWGLQVLESSEEAEWEEQPDGSFRVRREYRVA